MENFRFDRSVFKATTAVDAENHVAYWRTRSYRERLEAAFFLIKHAYRLDDNVRMDRTVFSKRSR